MSLHDMDSFGQILTTDSYFSPSQAIEEREARQAKKQELLVGSPVFCFLEISLFWTFDCC